MAIGVIIGGAFSAIVTAFTNKIIMPLVNLALAQGGAENGLEASFTFLKKVYESDEDYKDRLRAAKYTELRRLLKYYSDDPKGNQERLFGYIYSWIKDTKENRNLIVEDYKKYLKDGDKIWEK